jgi:hypothetical protein
MYVQEGQAIKIGAQYETEQRGTERQDNQQRAKESDHATGTRSDSERGAHKIWASRRFIRMMILGMSISILVSRK